MIATGGKVPTISIVGGTPAAEGEFPYVVGNTQIAFFKLIRNCFVSCYCKIVCLYRWFCA